MYVSGERYTTLRLPYDMGRPPVVCRL